MHIHIFSGEENNTTGIPPLDKVIANADPTSLPGILASEDASTTESENHNAEQEAARIPTTEDNGPGLRGLNKYRSLCQHLFLQFQSKKEIERDINPFRLDC